MENYNNDDGQDGFEQAPDQPIVNVQREKEKRNLIIIVALVFITMIGLIVYGMGGFSSEDEETNTPLLDNMAPPPAKDTRIESDKYGNQNFSRQMNSRTATDDENISRLTGDPVTTKLRSNENLTDNDIDEVKRTAQQNQYMPNTNLSIKERGNRDFQQKIRGQQNINNHYADENTPLFRKSPEEIREEQQAERQRQFDERQTNLVLSSLERANQNMERNNGQTQSPVSALSPNASQLVNPLSNKAVTSATNVLPKQPTNQAARLVPETAPNTIGQEYSRGFYSVTTAIKKEYYTDNEVIPAVVHGNADGITVSNGSSLKVRLTQNTVLISDGRKITLREGTLLSGQVSISGDRVQIYINSFQRGNALYPLSITAYDIDGVQGLYIPNVQNKQLLSRSLANAGTRPINSMGGFFTGGTVRQQVGTQLASQGIQTAMQGVSDFARTKAQNPRITIKSNYKILLKMSEGDNLIGR